MSVVRTLLFACLAAVAVISLRGQAPAGTLPTVLAAPGNSSLALGTTSSTDLTAVFGLPGVSGPVVQMQTTQGVINLELFPQTTPLTVANFLYYVNNKLFNSSIFDRSVPGFVIQSGSYTVNTANTITTIPAQAAVKNEYSLSNVRGTVAMAKQSTGSDPVDSATSAWFINLADNSSNLNNQNGGFTVFARVIGTGMTVADAIAALPVYSVAGLATVPLANVPSGATAVSYANWVRLPTVATIPIYPSTGVSGVLSFSASSSSPNTVNAAAVGPTLILYAASPGTAAITLTASDGNGNQASTTFNVTVAPFAFTSQPVSQTVASGSTVVFSAAVSAAATYQWQFNGAAIAGATSSRLLLGGATAGFAGSYTCVATSATGGAITSQPATLAISTATDVGRLINLSVLTSDVTGTQPVTLGFFIGGNTPSQSLLLRAAGPSLSAFSITTGLPDPKLTLFNSSSAVLATNTGWTTPAGNQASVFAANTATGAFQFPAGSLDSALVELLPSGASNVGYTITAQGKSGGAGTTLAEVYDANLTASSVSGASRLKNLSSLLKIFAGDTLTAGFTIGGSTARTVLIRATGPALAGLSVQTPMPDPALTLFTSAGAVLATNAGWGGDSQISAISASVGAFPLSDPTSKDSVILTTLAPGGYTAQVKSASGGGGNALVEVYEVP